MTMTIHSEMRAQQRGIPPLVIDLLMQYGNREHDHRGAEVVYFDQKSRKKVQKYVGGLFGKLSDYLQSYAVIADGKVVTVGLRYKPIKKDR